MSLSLDSARDHDNDNHDNDNHDQATTSITRPIYAWMSIA